MKKVVIGAMAVLALTACSNEEVIQTNEQNNEISFTAVTEKSLSRAEDGYCNKETPASFYASALYTKDNGSTYVQYFLNDQFDKEGSAKDGKTYVANGSYRYWPDLTNANYKLKMFAATNVQPTWNTGKTNMEAIGYTVEALVDKQKDFLYAVQDVTDVPSGGQLTINFRHALSQIEFAAINENKKIRVEIYGVSVANVNSKGNFAFPASTDGTVENHGFTGTYPDADKVGKWTLQSDKVQYNVTITPTEEIKSTSTSLTVYDGTEHEWNTNTMYLIPQQLASWNRASYPKPTKDPDKGTYFLVKAKIWNIADKGGIWNASDVLLWGDNSTSLDPTGAKDIAIPAPATNWEPGKRYVYTFVFTTTGNGGTDPDNGKDVLTPIKLTLTIDDFVNGGVDDPVNMTK